MRISLIQMGIRWQDQGYNIREAERLIRKAAASGADIACLPELFSTGVTLDAEGYAEAEGGNICRFLERQARENKLIVVGSFIERNPKSLPFNTSITFGPDGKVLAKYHKSHLFTYGGEDDAYSPGEPRVSTFNAKGFTICPLICYDLRFPEAFQAGLDAGADLFIIQANWPNPRRMHWETLLRARAIECQAFIAGVNQVGRSPKNTFFGGSRIISPNGDIKKTAGAKQAVMCTDISVDDAKKHRSRYPFAKERRRFSEAKASFLKDAS